MKKLVVQIHFFAVIMLVCGACHPDAMVDEGVGETATPVTVATIDHTMISDSIVLNATSSYVLKSYIKANTTGYLRVNDLRPGQFIKQGRLLFTITTKESKSIGNAVNKLDSTFRFSGVNRIRSTGSGYLVQLDHQPGDFVQEGEQLAVIIISGSFVFLMEMPYDLKPFIGTGKKVNVMLPDGEEMEGTITSSMPNVDPLSQTQKMIIKIKGEKNIPENLVAKVSMSREVLTHAVTVPVASILTDPQQHAFWIMKLYHDSIALRVPVEKGIESGNRVEIRKPVLSDSDQILISGNYGLEDSARVIVIPQDNNQ